MDHSTWRQTQRTFPKTQHAVQLIAPGELKLNRSKPVPTPGPHEILVKVEAVGLCFSDLKLLKQFHDHARKSEVVAGIERNVLAADADAICRAARRSCRGTKWFAASSRLATQVKKHKVGERCLVQTDYRQLPTAAGSNAAFGYNFDGGLQEYTLLDERVVIAPERRPILDSCRRGTRRVGHRAGRALGVRRRFLRDGRAKSHQGQGATCDCRG